MAKIRFPRYDFKHNRLMGISTALWFSVCALSGLLYWIGPTTLPLWYSLTQFTDQLAPSWAVVSFAALSTWILVIGFLYGRVTDLEHENYLAHLNWWAVCFLQGMLLLALLRIMKVIL